MKRDFDLIRSILLQAEAAPPGQPWLQAISWEGEPITAPVVAQHLAMMAEHGLIEARVPSVEHGMFAIGPLKWQGMIFLEAARSDTVWRKAKDKLLEVGGAASLEIFKAVLLQITKAQLGLP